MLIRDLVNDIEKLISLSPRPQRIQKDIIKSMLSAELQEITAKVDLDCLHVHLDPMISTAEGVREYVLPDNFPENFARGAGTSGDQYCCKLGDGSTDAVMTYKNPVQFYSQSLTGQTNGRPSTYTIAASQSGARKIVLSPPPDANGSTGYYTISGLYKPTDWELDDLSSVPPIPNNAQVLKYGVLRRVDPQSYEGKYQEAVSELKLSNAKSRPTTIVPNTSDVVYSLFRRW